MHTTQPPKVQDVLPKVTAEISDVQEKRPDYQVILTRNLFGPPPQEEKQVTTEQTASDNLEATSLDLELIGTISGPPHARRAIILDKEKKVQDIYHQGDTINGAVIKEIQRRKVTLNVNGKDEVLVPETPRTDTTTTTPDTFQLQLPHNIEQNPPPDMPSENVTEPEPIEGP